MCYYTLCSSNISLTLLLSHLSYQPPLTHTTLLTTSLPSLLTHLLYQPPHQPPLPASSPTSFTSLLTNLLYQPLPLAISKVGCKAKNHVYIWDLYPTIWGGKLESYFFPSH